MKMDLDTADEIYKQETEFAEKEFLEGIKNKGDVKILEKKYTDKLKTARENYSKNVSNYLKHKGIKLKEFNFKREKVKPFNVKNQNFDLNIFQKLFYYIKLKSFKIFFASRNFFRKHTPNLVSYKYISLKFTIKKLFVKLSNIIDKFIENVKTFIRKVIDKFKENLKKFYDRGVALPEKIISWILSKKSKTKSSEEIEKKS